MTAVAGVIALAFAAAGCSSSSSGGGPVKPTYVCKLSGKGKTLKVGIDTDQPGLGYQDSQEIHGLDADIARCVAGELGYGSVDFVPTNAPDREKVLENGTVQMVAATFSMTAAREQQVSFAGPYFVTGQAVMVRTESPIKGVQDLAGKKVCSVTGTTSVDNLLAKQPKLVPEKYNSFTRCALDLADGKVDAMTTDEAILAGYSAQQQYAGKFKIVGSTFSVEKYGLGLKHGDPACQQTAKALQKVIDDGTWKKIVKNNLGNFAYDKSQNPPKKVSCV
ncbi:glutamate ABC transporter substrate-binding protein [Flexivirga caeni]|nr:glutamate ABC transporter substrate-binding protein [Flexivirga caeni]